MNPFDYKYFKMIGNTCEGYTPDVNNLSVEDSEVTKRAALNAFKLALTNYLIKVVPGKYWDNQGNICTGCIDSLDLSNLINHSNGIIIYLSDTFEDVNRRFWNSLFPAGHLDKKSGIITTTQIRKLVYPANQEVSYTLTVDYTNAQVPSKALYTEYRTKLGIAMQKIKEFHYMSMKMPLTVFTPPV